MYAEIVTGVAALVVIGQAVVYHSLTAKLEARQEHERSVLLNRIMSRSFEQFQAHEPDSFLASKDPSPARRVLFDETGLLEVEVPHEDE